MLKFLIAAVFVLALAEASSAAAPTGFHAVLEIDFKSFWHDELAGHFDDLKRRLDKAQIVYTDLKNAAGLVSVRIANASPRKQAIAAMTVVLTRYNGHFLVASVEPDMLTIAPEPGYRRETEQKLLDQSLSVVRRRVEALSLTPATVRAIGASRIAIELAGTSHVAEFAALFAPPPVLTVNLVDDAISQTALAQGIAPTGETILPEETRPGEALRKIAVRNEPLLGGERIRWAENGIDERSGEPIVSVHFDEEGAAIFADVTRKNVMRRLAIVIDGRVVSAPVINEPIVGGNVQISGAFTTEQAQDLAARLTRGSIPAPIRIIESSAGPLRQ